MNRHGMHFTWSILFPIELRCDGSYWKQECDCVSARVSLLKLFSGYSCVGAL
jgi:hypothetical protein